MKQDHFRSCTARLLSRISVRPMVGRNSSHAVQLRDGTSNTDARGVYTRELAIVAQEWEYCGYKRDKQLDWSDEPNRSPERRIESAARSACPELCPSNCCSSRYHGSRVVERLRRTRSRAQLPPQPDVILVTIDTLRADRVGVYGGLPAATPTSTGSRAGVSPSWTRLRTPPDAPSHASILTGHTPRTITSETTAGSRCRAVADACRDAYDRGYHTAAFVASYVLNRGTGLARGFETMAIASIAAPHLSLSSLQRRGPEVARDAVRWLATALHPFFLWVHF